MTHWHVDRETGQASRAAGPVDSTGCCKGSATWGEIYGKPRPVCPECRDGKHQNCARMALDEQTDEITSCWCELCQTLADDDRARAEQRREESA